MESKPEKQTLSKTRKLRTSKGLSLKRRLFRKCQRTCSKSKRSKRVFKSMLSPPNPSSLIFISMGAFSFMCYLLGLDPSLIPFTLLFTLLVTLLLLDGTQRSLILTNIVPSFLLNICSSLWHTLSTKPPQKQISIIEPSNASPDIEHMQLNDIYYSNISTKTE